MKRILSLYTFFTLFATVAWSTLPGRLDTDPRIRPFHSITLEMSLKPFKQNNEAYFEQVCRTLFEQWEPLLVYTDTVSVMLWTADGSEILNYQGMPSQPLEWSRYIGNPNTGREIGSGPKELSIHDRAYYYMENPPSYTYGDLKKIVATLKRVGREVTGKPIRVGETFDPGPEFAKSEFKYKKHPEICMGGSMGEKSMVCCYATLNQDTDPYAGYPDGIPQGTPFGTFFGKQCQAFLTDMGFDYIWLSNGLGFGMETWGSTGAIFDGKAFHREKLPDIHHKIVEFWSKFRAECPDFRIETRGTNISASVDLAKDGVDLRAIYNGGFNMLPPPNSPWAALDGNFGLELAGYMSRIAMLPDDRYLFRYYTHDPWWVNSPWLDRYGREPHDIYLPMSIVRLDAKGDPRQPTHLNFLSVDDSYGNMPDQVPNEVTPHLLHARRHAPDEAGPVLWVYPFDEYYDRAQQQPERLEEIYYGDWFVQQGINDGFPLNTVISTTHFLSALQQQPDKLKTSVLLTVVPDAGSEMERRLMEFVGHGGRAIVYGPIGYASKKFLEFLNVKAVAPVEGEFRVSLAGTATDLLSTAGSSTLRHLSKWSGGGIETVVANTTDTSTRSMAQASRGNERRDIAIHRSLPQWNGGSITYLRGTNSAIYKGGHLLTPDHPDEFFNGASLLRRSLDQLGYSIRYTKLNAPLKNPINCISKTDNGYYFSGYTPNQTVEQRMKFPQGAPLFTGFETELKNGYATYRMPKAYFEECRVFVEQTDGVVSCYEIAPVQYKVVRRIGIGGLKNAKVRVYPPHSSKELVAVNNVGYPYAQGYLPLVKGREFEGNYYEFDHINGTMVIAWE